MHRFADWVKWQGRRGRSVLRWATLPYCVLRRDRRPGLVVLLYHRVGGGSNSEIDLPVSIFDRQVRYLRRYYRIVSLDDVVQFGARRTLGTPRQDTIAITFDDGCAETYDVVYPILRQYGIPATVYIPTMYIEDQRPLDFGAYRNVDPAVRPRPLSWDHIMEMVCSNLVVIGAHTHTHADLSRVSEEEAIRELDACDQVIDSRLGFRPKHFAYPWGSWCPATQALVASRYKSVTLGGTGKNPYISLNLSKLQRYPVVRSDGFRLFRARLGTLAKRGAWSGRGSGLSTEDGEDGICEVAGRPPETGSGNAVFPQAQ